MKHKTKVVKCKWSNQWVLLDETNFAIAYFSSPSKARKAKLYWWLYLTLESDHMKYLDKIAEMQGG